MLPTIHAELAAPTHFRKRRKATLKKVLKKPDGAEGGVSARAQRRKETLLRARSRDKMSPEEWRDAYDVRIREALGQAGITHKELADAVTHPPTSPKAGKTLGRSAITNWLNRNARPSVDQYSQIAAFLKARAGDSIPEKYRTAKYLAYGDAMEPLVVLPDTDELGYHTAPEVDITGPERRHRKPAPHGVWGLQADFLKSDLNIPLRPDVLRDIVVVRSREDSQGIEFGDRMVVDCTESARSPSPPGKFLVWDGFASTIASITLLPQSGKRPRVKVITAAGESEVDPEKVDIIGRIRGVWKKV